MGCAGDRTHIKAGSKIEFTHPPAAPTPITDEELKTLAPKDLDQIAFKGTYNYGGTDMDMDFEKCSFAVGTKGTLAFGGSDDTGPFNAVGVYRTDGTTRIQKTFVGAHSIYYEGKLEKGGMKGKYKTPGLTDTFDFWFTTEKWVVQDYWINIETKGTAIIGVGKDNYAFGKWKGTIDAKGDAAVKIFYADGIDGSFKGNKKGAVVEGTITNPQGTFEITWDVKAFEPHVAAPPPAAAPAAPAAGK